MILFAEHDDDECEDDECEDDQVFVCGLAFGLADTDRWFLGRAEGASVCGCPVCWLLWRQETVFTRRYVASMSHELRMRVASKNLAEVVEETVLFGLFKKNPSRLG